MADRFWVGGSGNWSDAATHWAAASGAAPGAGNLPTAADRAIFDAASNATAYTVTVDIAAVCLDLLFNAAPSGSGTITWAGALGMTISGSMTLLAGMTRSITGTLTFNSTAAGRTITTNGVVLSNNMTFNGVGGGWQVVGALSNSGGSIIQLLAGALDTNGQTISWGSFQTSGSLTRSLTLGATTMTCASGGNVWLITSTTGFTLSALASTLNITAAGIFTGGGLTYGTVNYTFGAANNTFADGNTFGALSLIGRATKTDPGLTLAANQSVTGTFSAAGNSTTNRVLVQSNTTGTPRTITAAIAALSNADFMDIAGAGVAAPFGGASLGDCLGNSGITFTPSATQFAKAGASFLWSDATKWFLATNGGGGAGRVPLPQDNVVFDASSITAAGVSITMDMPRACRSVDFSLITNAPTLTSAASLVVNVFGSWTMGSGLGTWNSGASSSLQMSARSPVTFSCAGKVCGMTLVVNVFGGSITLLDAFQQSRIQMNNGTFDANGFNVTAVHVLANASTVKTITMGSGTWTLISNDTSGSAPWNIGGGTVVNAGTSTIKFTDVTASLKSFNGGGKTYNNVWFAGSGAAHQMTGSNVFNQLKVDPSQTLNFTAATTTTAASWVLDGATIGSITAAQHTLAKSGAGKVQANGATISQSAATPANTFYAANSTNGGSNSGWVFGAYLALDAMAPVLAAFPAWSVRKNWRVAIGTLPVAAAFGDVLLRDVRIDPFYIISAESRTRSISR